jgi:vacuolar-type H+-ATPase subunit I/STV1
MMSTSLPIDRDEYGAILVEEGRTPECFAIILDYLRSGRLNCVGIPEDDVNKMQEILQESDYYGTIKLSNYLRQLINDNLESVRIQEEIEKQCEQAQKEAEMKDDAPAPIDPKQIEEMNAQDEKWAEHFSQLTLEHAKNATKYFDEETEQLNQRKQELEEAKKKLIQNQEFKKFMLRLNVGGREFSVDLATLSKFEDSIFTHVFKKLGKLETGKSYTTIQLT